MEMDSYLTNSMPMNDNMFNIGFSNSTTMVSPSQALIIGLGYYPLMEMIVVCIQSGDYFS